MVGLLAVASALLPRGFALDAVSDIQGALLMLMACIAFAANGRASTGRLRWFWLLQASGWALWLADQLVWVTYDLILRRPMPSMSAADGLLFLAGAPMVAGVLLRPHLQPGERSVRLGVLDFSLLSLWWLYLYVSFVVCWQVVSPSEAAYNRNFDLLSGAFTILYASLVLLFMPGSSGRWKKFYACLCAAVLFNGISFYALNRALENNTYFTGSWYDISYSGSFALFVGVAAYGQGLLPRPERTSEASYGAWIANLAMMAVLSLPLIAFYALLDTHLPQAASHFRVLVALATMFLMAFLLFLQHYRLNRDLRRANGILREASLTDHLTGLRNRRYFSATIERDVSQALRSHADHHDSHTRDLVFYLIDIDNFKDVNDRYGHDVGDQVLIEMSRRLSSSIRHSDVLVRWGGEEFLVVSRYTDRNEAELLASRTLASVADTPFLVGPSKDRLYRTCSIGWATFPWFLTDPRALTYEEVLTLADRALNQAKRQGKNRAIGMLPAVGHANPTTVEGVHSRGLEVDVLAIPGPQLRS